MLLVTLQPLRKGFGQVLPVTIAPSLETGKWYISYVYVAGVRGTERQMNSFLPPPQDPNTKIIFFSLSHMLAGLFTEAAPGHVEVLLERQLPELLALRLCVEKRDYAPTGSNGRNEE